MWDIQLLDDGTIRATLTADGTTVVHENKVHPLSDYEIQCFVNCCINKAADAGINRDLLTAYLIASKLQ